MNPITEDIASNDQNGFDFDLLNKRLEGYKNSENAFDYQNGIERSNKICNKFYFMKQENSKKGN